MDGLASEIPTGWDILELSKKGAVPDAIIHWNFMARMWTRMILVPKTQTQCRITRMSDATGHTFIELMELHPLKPAGNFC